MPSGQSGEVGYQQEHWHERVPALDLHINWISWNAPTSHTTTSKTFIRSFHFLQLPQYNRISKRQDQSQHTCFQSYPKGNLTHRHLPSFSSQVWRVLQRTQVLEKLLFQLCPGCLWLSALKWCVLLRVQSQWAARQTNYAADLAFSWLFEPHACVSNPEDLFQGRSEELWPLLGMPRYARLFLLHSSLIPVRFPPLVVHDVYLSFLILVKLYSSLSWFLSVT